MSYLASNKAAVPMLKYILLALFVFFPGTSWSQTEVDSSKIVRVLTLNILHGATTKGDFDLDAIAKVIIEAKPDLVALQEVDFKTNRAKGYDLVTELGWRAKLQGLFGRAMPYDGGEYGEGVLSGFTLLSSTNHALPYSPGNEPRAALAITTQLPSGDTITFIGTHLDHLRDETDRLAQTKALNKIFRDHPHPMILAGDLNDVPGSEPMDILESFWTSAYQGQIAAPTYPSDGPSKKIDYVMFYPRQRWQVLERRVICDAIASDHCGYLVTLVLLE